MMVHALLRSIEIVGVADTHLGSLSLASSEKLRDMGKAGVVELEAARILTSGTVAKSVKFRAIRA